MSLLDVVLPVRCVGCGASGASPCAACVERLVPVGVVDVGSPVELAVAAVRYDDHSARFVGDLKRRGTRPTVEWFAHAIADVVRRHGEHPDLVTWVPANRRHRRRRGFDQGALLARAVGRQLAVPAVATVDRRRGRAQTGRPRADRLRGPDVRTRPTASVDARHVLVVDDVITTGASVRRVAEALADRGASRVVVAAATHRP